MLNAVNSIQNWFYEIPPNGIAVKVFALTPVVSNIFLVLKERQYMRGYRENYVNPDKVRKSTYLHEPPVDLKVRESEKQINALSKISTTIVNWGQAQRIALLAGLIITAPLWPTSVIIGSISLLTVTQLHHFWSWHKVTSIIADR